MKRTYKLENLDCANCAAKMERKIKKIKGVDDASVNFMAQKLTLEAGDEVFEQVLSEAVQTVSRVEPDCRVILQ